MALISGGNPVPAAPKPGYQVACDSSLESAKPVYTKHYPPAPMNQILRDVCQDNGLLFDLDTDKKLVKLQTLDSNKAPDSDPNGNNRPPIKFCFRGTIPGAYIIGPFSIQDYATATFESEITDLNLFDSILIFDDSGAPELFANFSPFSSMPVPFHAPQVIKSFKFYILEYEFFFTPTKSTTRCIATNNWFVSNFRLDTLFENAVFAGLK